MMLWRLIALGMCVSCASVEPVLSESTRLDELASGAFSQSKREFLVISDAEQFRRVFSAIHQPAPDGRNPPVIDFERNIVLVAFMGKKPSTGYAIGFEPWVHIEGGVARVRVIEQTPEPGTVLGMVITSPFVMARLARVDFREVRLVDAEGEVLARQALEP